MLEKFADHIGTDRFAIVQIDEYRSELLLNRCCFEPLDNHDEITKWNDTWIGFGTWKMFQELDHKRGECSTCFDVLRCSTLR